jgi:hypothetical protein
LSTANAGTFRRIHIISEERKKEKRNPRAGAIKINATIFITPAVIIDPNPELATAEPMSPPTRVCDELDGRPHHQVNKFQVMAAIRAAPMTLILIASVSTTPLPIVEATFK